MPYYKIIPSSADPIDFNDMTTFGWYIFGADSYVATCTNTPPGKRGGLLIVMPYNATDGWSQIYIDQGQSFMWKRYYRYWANPPAWSNWATGSNIQITSHDKVISKSMASYTSESFTISITNSVAGMYPLGILGVETAGSGVSWFNLVSFYLSSRSQNAGTIHFALRNIHPSNTIAAGCTYTFHVLWARYTTL